MGTKTNELERKAFSVRELKLIDDGAGIGEGYVSVFGNLDGNGDVVDRGAFTKTIREARETKERNKTPYLFPLLWQHKEQEPIGGILDAYEDDHGLFIRFQYDMDIEQGRRAYSGAKKGYIRGLSIGYVPVKVVFKDHNRHLTEIRLFEGSPVTFPANDEAQIVSVKSLQIADPEGDDIVLTKAYHIEDDLCEGPDEAKGASGSTRWPIASRDRGWDKGAAHSRLLDWAGGTDNLSASKMKSVHFWYDPSAPDQVTSYKFPFCDIVDGKPTAVPHAIFNGAARLEGAKIDDKSGVQSKMGTYYRRMAKQFKDPTLKAPWDDSTGKSAEDALKEDKSRRGPIAMLPNLAHSLHDSARYDHPAVESLANMCGMSMDDTDTKALDSHIAALLGNDDDLGRAVRGVINSHQEHMAQTKALLQSLHEPIDDDIPYGGYMSDLRSALLEWKAGRKISRGTAQEIMNHVSSIEGATKGLRSLADPAGDLEMENRPDYGDIIASGQPNQSGGKSLGGTGTKPGNGTTSTTALSEPGNPTLGDIADLVHMSQIQDLLEKGN